MPYKIIIIGGGPGGYVAAIRAAQLGARVALVERGPVGGTCLNRGCIPTKALAAGVYVLNTARRAGEFGVNTGEVSVDLGRLMERKNMLVGRLVQGVEALLRKNEVDLIKGSARLSGRGRVVVDGIDGIEGLKGTREIRGESIILATGTEPALLKCCGYDGRQVVTSDEALNLTEVPEKLLIVGGGIIGSEFACIFSALGSKVTIIENMPTILPLLDKEVSRQMQGLMKRQGIKIRTGAKISEVSKRGELVTAILEGGEEIAASKLLLAAGRAMNVKGLGLEEAGVTTGERGQVLVNDSMETAVKGLYAIGDIVGEMQLAHVASAQGLVAADNIMGLHRRMDYRVVPYCIFTQPEVAGVGITAQEAEKAGIKVKVAKFPFVASGKAQVMGETDGFVKLLSDPATDKILGVHIVGPHATDLIAEAALAMQLGSTVRQLMETIHAHPTLAESIMEAAGAVHGMSIHG
ncbi:MAG: dihydrolipoyl dehydrogenase [Desulfocucumaceae bacterium]